MTAPLAPVAPLSPERRPAAGHKSKTLATWIALVGGSLGLHRIYLGGWRDVWAWLYPLPTLLGLYGVYRMRHLGQDDQFAWLLIPLLGLSLSASMLSAIVYGLTSDERWQQRHNPGDSTPEATGWGAIMGVVLALLIGAGVLMATLAFGGQRYFEHEIEAAQ